MGETEAVVTPIRVEKVCPECGKGTMEKCGGMVLTTYPAQYPHQCTKCEHSQHYSGVQYPYIKHRDKGDIV